MLARRKSKKPTGRQPSSTTLTKMTTLKLKRNSKRSPRPTKSSAIHRKRPRQIRQLQTQQGPISEAHLFQRELLVGSAMVSEVTVEVGSTVITIRTTTSTLSNSLSRFLPGKTHSTSTDSSTTQLRWIHSHHSSRPLLRRRLPVIRTSETTGQMALLLLNPAQTAGNPPGPVSRRSPPPGGTFTSTPGPSLTTTAQSGGR